MGDYIDLYELFYLVYVGLNQYEVVFKNFQFYEELEDSIYIIEVDWNFKEVKIKFEIE